MIEACIGEGDLTLYCDVEVRNKLWRSGHNMFKLWVGESAFFNDVRLSNDSCCDSFLLLFSKSFT